MPAPDVDSAVIRLDVRKEPPVAVEKEENFFKVVKGAFSQRRKTLSNTLSSAFGMSKQTLHCGWNVPVLRQISVQNSSLWSSLQPLPMHWRNKASDLSTFSIKLLAQRAENAVDLCHFVD